jgi:hypothetical protein
MSYKYGEIFVWGNARLRAIQATPLPPPCLKSAELTRGKRAGSGRGREIQTRNLEDENGGKGGKITQNDAVR